MTTGKKFGLVHVIVGVLQIATAIFAGMRRDLLGDVSLLVTAIFIAFGVSFLVIGHKEMRSEAASARAGHVWLIDTAFFLGALLLLLFWLIVLSS